MGTESLDALSGIIAERDGRISHTDLNLTHASYREGLVQTREVFSLVEEVLGVVVNEPSYQDLPIDMLPYIDPHMYEGHVKFALPGARSSFYFAKIFKDRFSGLRILWFFEAKHGEKIPADVFINELIEGEYPQAYLDFLQVFLPPFQKAGYPLYPSRKEQR